MKVRCYWKNSNPWMWNRNRKLEWMNSNLKSVDVNVPGRWLTKAKKEWSKGWPNLESWNFSVQTHALLSSILPSSSKLQRLRRFQSFLHGWGKRTFFLLQKQIHTFSLLFMSASCFNALMPIPLLNCTWFLENKVWKIKFDELDF